MTRYKQHSMLYFACSKVCISMCPRWHYVDQHAYISYKILKESKDIMIGWLIRLRRFISTKVKKDSKSWSSCFGERFSIKTNYPTQKFRKLINTERTSEITKITLLFWWKSRIHLQETFANTVHPQLQKISQCCSPSDPWFPFPTYP